MPDTTSEIQDYLLKQRREDPIETKSLDRATWQLAKDIKANKGLKTGKCNTCGRDEEKLIPVVMDLCPVCVNRYMKQGHELEVLSKDFGNLRCEACLTRTFHLFKTNPRVCQYCSKKIGNKHKYGQRESKSDERARDSMLRRRGVRQ